MLLAPDDHVGPYRIISAIGRGGFGEVYVADDPRLRRQVAIKILNARFVDDEVARGRFLREAQMAAALDHPGVCTLHEIGAERGFDYLVMPYLRGETLAQRLERGRPPLPAALDIAVQLADALAYAHTQGVIHRDIKPQNVMLTLDGRVKLMDFGLAKVPGRLDDQQETQLALTQAGDMLGTIAYMSPEQLAGESADEQSDVFSLGVTLYELFAGRHPFEAATAVATITAITTQSAAPLTTAVSDAPPALTRMLAKALARDPQQRYQSARDLLIDLETERRGGSVPSPSAASGGRWTPRRVAVMTVLGLAITVSATAAIVHWSRAVPAAPPANAVTTPAAATSSLSTWLEIQPKAAGAAGDAYDSTGGDTLKDGWKFRVHIEPSASGSLYIVSDEHPLSSARQDLTLLFPMADAVGAISGPMMTDWYVVSGPVADTSVWVVWSRTTVRELEMLKPLVNASARGVIRDPATSASVRQMLDAAVSKVTAIADEAARRTTVRSSLDIVAHRFLLKQR